MKRWIIVLGLSFLPHGLYAHGNEHHHDEPLKVQSSSEDHRYQEIMSNINARYLREIKPIFKQKCFDCHSNATRYPWYYRLPGAKQLIDADIKEARKHLDMGKDFPFVSHATPMEDLKALRKIGMDGGMPPFRYLIGHWKGALSKDEKAKIADWSSESAQLLENVR